MVGSATCGFPAFSRFSYLYVRGQAILLAATWRGALKRSPLAPALPWGEAASNVTGDRMGSPPYPVSCMRTQSCIRTLKKVRARSALFSCEI